MNISQNIKKYREKFGMEQQDLAAKLNISNKTVSSWECGRTEPRMGMIEAMSEIFGCEKTELIDGTPARSHDAVLLAYAKKLSELSMKRQESVLQFIDFMKKEDENENNSQN